MRIEDGGASGFRVANRRGAEYAEPFDKSQGERLSSAHGKPVELCELCASVVNILSK